MCLPCRLRNKHGIDYYILVYLVRSRLLIHQSVANVVLFLICFFAKDRMHHRIQELKSVR
jgi:hypothetical protein